MKKTRKLSPRRSRLTLHRETLAHLGEDRLATAAVGAAPETRPPQHCLTPLSCVRTCTC